MLLSKIIRHAVDLLVHICKIMHKGFGKFSPTYNMELVEWKPGFRVERHPTKLAFLGG